MRYNPIAMLYRAAQLCGAIYRRVGLIVTTQIYHATLKSVGKGSQFQAGVRFANPDVVTVGQSCYFWRGVDASSEITGAILEVGNHVQINRDVHLDITGGLTIGDDVMISESAVIYTHDHGLDPRAAPQAYEKTISADVWIGMRAVILPQCQRIGQGAVVGAGAIVTADVPDYAVVAGNPARVIGSRVPGAKGA